jgi:hypothetical protein
VDGLGVGNVVKNSVVNIVILQRVLNFQQVVRIMIQAAVEMNQNLNKKNIVAVVIIVIVERGGNII